MSLWGELRQRNVFKVGSAYAIVAWLLVQVASTVFPDLGLPSWASPLVTVLLLIGFPIALLLAWAYELTPDGIKRTRLVSGDSSARTSAGSPMTYVVVGLLAVAIAYLLADRYWLMTERSAGLVHLAVLPCDDSSPDPNDSYFARGFHDEIINRLGQVSDLRVTSRSSVIRFADQRPAIPEIAKLLGVSIIMECGVRYSQNELAMTAQLIDGATDTQVWSRSYQRDISDVRRLFDLQINMAVDVAEQVRVALQDRDLEAIERVPTESGEAYLLYLAALQENGSAIDRKISLLLDALDIDPNFVDALIGLADVHLSTISGSSGIEREEKLVDARDALDRAEAIERGNGRLASSEAFYAQTIGQWTEAERMFRVAQARQRGYASASYATLSYAVGHFESGRQLLDTHIETNPLNAVARGFLLAGMEMSGDATGRRREFLSGEALFEQWWGDHVEMFLSQGDHDNDFLRVPRPDGLTMPIVWDLAARHVDDPEEGLEALRSQYSSADESWRSAKELATLASWAAYFGDPALALSAIRDATELQPNQIWVVWLPIFESVRREPRFEGLIESSGLPEYWSEFGYPDDCAWLTATRFPCR